MSRHDLKFNRHLKLDDKPALVDATGQLTFADYHRAVNATAAWLDDLGVKPGQRIGLLGENSVDYVVTLTAIVRSGALACPLNPRFPVATLSRMLETVNGTTVLHSPTVRPNIAGIDFVPMPDIRSLTPVPEATAEPQLDRDATILFTSGSESTPKAVLHTFGNHYFSALGSNENIGLQPGDRWLLSLPLYHAGGLGIVFRCLLAGAAVVVPDKNDSIGVAVEKYSVSHLSLVPTQLRELLEDLPSVEKIRCVLVGGSHVPGNLIRDAVECNLKIRTTYGSTEAASQIATTAEHDPLEKLITSGRCLKYRQLRVADDGELMVRGETMCRGYVTPSGIERPFDGDGWFHTGDIGHIDRDGFVTVTGRKDNMFISGGENIHPEEIETVIRAIEGVEEAVVVPIEDEKFGHRPVAFVKVADDSRLDNEEVLVTLSRSLPRFMIPDRLLSWPQDVKATGMKLDRGYFRDLAREIPG